jgi:hypothetical protein
VGCVVLCLAGCEEYRARRDAVVAEHGNAVAHNIAVQTIDPWPPASGNTRIDVDGERILIGVDRYKANKSLEPKGLPTQRVSTGSGGSGSGSGGTSP